MPATYTATVQEESDIDAALARLSATANRIADQRNDLLQEARANLMALEHIRAYLAKHAATLPPMSAAGIAAGIDVRIEKTRAAIARATEA